MTFFTTNKIFLEAETISEQIKKARTEKGLSINEISQKLNISAKHLEALERGDLSSLPSGVYSKNFLKEYIVFLGLDYQSFLKVFEKDLAAKYKTNQKEMFSRQIAKTKDFLAAPKIIKNAAIVLLIIGCFFYLGYAIKNIVSPPDLIIESPENDYITTKKIVEIRGITAKEAEITINGEIILGDIDGRFSKEISLKEGINTIIIAAKKKHGQENIVQRQILVKEE